ncbi:MAG: hypothetical protein HUJ29_13420 [Gammaproteobacteria bacterium]|nr:hypothetical protein [Gammaproteobacteria bacterium]
MFKFLKKSAPPATPMEAVKQTLSELDYELNENGIAAAQVKLDSGSDPVEVATWIAVISMAYQLKHAGAAATGVLRFRPQAADLLEKVTALKEDGHLEARHWQELHDAILGISSINEQQARWIDDVLSHPLAQSSPLAQHK